MTHRKLSSPRQLSAHLKSSLSMEGRSSWMRDMVWIISREQAVGMACSMVPPISSQAARHSAGRTRLPPAEGGAGSRAGRGKGEAADWVQQKGGLLGLRAGRGS